ncbi:MAG: hypothetical protein LRZ84_12720 [Desertifilum sp.]|nr:hypothetical protein [Desertifilum sp.]
MARKLTERNTKAEILEAYNTLLKEKKTTPTQPTAIPKETTAIIQEHPALEVRKFMSLPSPSQPRIEQTIENLVKLQQGLGSAVSELSEKLTTEATQLEEIQVQVSEELTQLSSLHSLEFAEGTLEELILTYETQSKAFTEEFFQQRETLEQEFQDLRKAWQKEKEEHSRTVKERNNEQAKARQRDLETYQYDLEFRRTQDIDRYEYTKKILEKELEELRQNQEKQWTERETALAERERQFQEFRKKVEEFPKELEANIKRGKDSGRNIAHYQVKIKADLVDKEIEGQKNFYELRLQSLQQTIQSQESRIQSLSKQLDSALKQVQDLAVKAIEGSSNLNSSQMLKEIALEQAKQLKSK